MDSLKSKIRSVPDFPKPGINFFDITTLLRDRDGFRSAIDAMAAGDVLCLENTRFHQGEERNDPDFITQLAALGDIFVNDAFSVSDVSFA